MSVSWTEIAVHHILMSPPPWCIPPPHKDGLSFRPPLPIQTVKHHFFLDERKQTLCYKILSCARLKLDAVLSPALHMTTSLHIQCQIVSKLTPLGLTFHISDLLDAQRFKMFRNVFMLVHQNVLFDILASSVLTLQVCAVGNEPAEQISVIKLCDLEYDRCAEFVSCVDVKTLREKPCYTLLVILHRQIVEHCLSQAVHGETKRRLTTNERRSFLKLPFRYEGAQLIPCGRSWHLTYNGRRVVQPILFHEMGVSWTEIAVQHILMSPPPWCIRSYQEVGIVLGMLSARVRDTMSL